MNSSSVEQPTPDGHHPAYGMIGANRTSGLVTLYGSDFLHSNFMTIRIVRGKHERNMSDDNYYGSVDALIEVQLSEAQWATFVSAPNVGHGTPCTIRSINRVPVPLLPPPVDRSEQFKGEAGKSMAEAITALEKLIGKIDDLGVSNKKAEPLKALVETARRRISERIDFVAEMFSEHCEVTVERAKSEVHGYMTSVISRAGMAHLQLPLHIDEGRPAKTKLIEQWKPKSPQGTDENSSPAPFVGDSHAAGGE